MYAVALLTSFSSVIALLKYGACLTSILLVSVIQWPCQFSVCIIPVSNCATSELLEAPALSVVTTFQ